MILLVSNFCMGQTETASKNYVNSATNALWSATTNKLSDLLVYQNIPYATTVTVSTATSTARKVQIDATGDMTIACTNGVDGSSVKWSIFANGADCTINLPNTMFHIPTSASTTYSLVVSNGTESVFFTEFKTRTGKWHLQSYIWGY